MKKRLLLEVLLALIFISCTTMEYANVVTDNENLIYQNDFSMGLDDFSYEIEENEIIEIQDGTLHLDGFGKDKNRILLELHQDFPHASIISFRIKLFSGQTSTHSTAPRRATLFFAGSYPDNEIQIMFHTDSISFRQKQEGTLLNSDSYSTRINGHTWYDVVILFEDDRVTVYKDGSAKKSFAFVTPLLEKNNLSFYTNKEYWVDDLEIRTYSDVTYVEPE